MAEQEEVHVAMSYRQITAELDNCEESDAVLEILQEEIAGPNRPAFVNRIYGRYDTLRRAEERLDLARAATGDVAPWLAAAPAPAAPPPRAAGKPANKGAATPVQGGAGKPASKSASKPASRARA